MTTKKWSEIKRAKGAPARTTYLATAERDGRFWLVQVPGLRGVRAQVRRLEEAEGAIRGAIALWFEVPEDSFDVKVSPGLGGDFDARILETIEARMQAEKAASTAAVLTHGTAIALVEQGLTVRDVGDILGLSHQRVAQLVASGPAVAEPRPQFARHVEGLDWIPADQVGRVAAKRSEERRTR